ncbi:MAG TPA: hypothetical protein VG097_00375 [Gemmata sp.]|nr:hypothetical protein [Gemmata sp.]
MDRIICVAAVDVIKDERERSAIPDQRAGVKLTFRYFATLGQIMFGQILVIMCAYRAWVYSLKRVVQHIEPRFLLSHVTPFFCV